LIQQCKVRAALNAIDGADRVAHFLVDVTRKCPDAWWCEDFTMRFALVNGLPGVVVDSPEGPVQTTAFEIEGDVVTAIYVVRNPDKITPLGGGYNARALRDKRLEYLFMVLLKDAKRCSKKFLFLQKIFETI
jgi:hypothetical protein